MNNLPTRERCLEIVNTCETDTFYRTTDIVNGYQVEFYNYRLASYTDFINNNALELRGIMFIYDHTTEEWIRHIALRKFFNLNQTIGYMAEDFKGKKILDISEKFDGSMITFVKFPNNKIIAKTKMKFDSPQAIEAQNLVNNNPVLLMNIENMINKGWTPIFELVSPTNQIVLFYERPELKLLQVRDTSSGKYLDISMVFEEFPIFERKLFSMPDSNATPIEYFLEFQEHAKDIEGIVFTTEETLVKVKTIWYMNLHHNITEELKLHNLIPVILNEQVDDLIALLKDVQKRNFINEVQIQLEKIYNNMVQEIIELYKEFKIFETKKEFAIKYNQHIHFHTVMRIYNIDENEIEEVVEKVAKNVILDKTRTMEMAKKFIYSTN